GVAAALFASAAVPLILGNDWKLAVPLIQVLGLSAAADQIGFNWTAFARARGETRILGIASLAMLLAVVSVGVPLLLAMGLSGLAIGIGAGTLATLTIRMIYLTRLFPAARMASHVLRAIGLTGSVPDSAGTWTPWRASATRGESRGPGWRHATWPRPERRISCAAP